MADVFKHSKLVCTVPVAWADQVVFDRAEKRPKEFLVWLRTPDKAVEWARQETSIIAIAHAIDPKEHPRRFKEFSRLYRVSPIGPSEDPRSVRALFMDLVTADSFPS
jgi:hypothetical protein